MIPVVWPTGVLNAACSNSGTVRPRVIGGSNPPSLALPGSSEYFFASSSKLAPAFSCLEMSSALACGRFYGLLIHFAVGIGSRSLDQDMANRNRLGNAVVVLVLAVVLL